MKIHDLCLRCKKGTMERYAGTRKPDSNKAVRYLRCSNESCDARGQEKVDIGPPRKKNNYPMGKNLAKKQQTKIEKSCPGVKIQPAPIQHAEAAGDRKDNFMLLNIFQTAQKCDCDPNTIKDWTDYGLMPAPLVVGLSLRWRESDLQSWVENGCPKMSVPSETELDHLWRVLDAELTGNLPQQFDNELAEIEQTRKD
jgi:hypothetical protein